MSARVAGLRLAGQPAKRVSAQAEIRAEEIERRAEELLRELLQRKPGYLRLVPDATDGGS